LLTLDYNLCVVIDERKGTFMKKSPKKLSLHRESLRLLSVPVLERAVAGRAADPWTEVLCPTAPNSQCDDPPGFA
jgi:hypothetical protein